MARSKTAQPKHSLRKIAVVVATAVSGMSVYAQAAVEPKEDTITVTAAPAPQESAWGPAATIAARQSATGTKTDTPIQKVPQSISVVTAEEMALHVNNLFDREYVASCFNTYGCFWGAERQVVATATFRF